MEKDKQYDCGVLLGINYKYGKTPHLFDDFGKTLSLLEEYPILYDYLPPDLKSNKQVVLTVIKANNKFVHAYANAIEYAMVDDVMVSSSVIRANMGDASRNAYPKGLPNGIIDPFMADVDVLAALENSMMWDDIILTDQNYHENLVARVASQAPAFAKLVYDYWESEIKNHPREVNKISKKYNLRTDAPASTVAMYKCFDVLRDDQFDCTNAIGFVLARKNARYYDDDEKCSEDVKRIFQKLSKETQNHLAQKYYSLIPAMRADDLDDDIVQEVVKYCSIAVAILPESYILKCKLNELEYGEAEKLCSSCQACFWKNVRFV